MRTRLHALLFAVLPVTGFVAPAAVADTIEIEVAGLEFTPADVVVRPGDVVRWVRLGGSHTATSGTECTPDGLFDGVLDAANPVFEWTVPDDASGLVPYYCTPHCEMGMVGSLFVDSGAQIRHVAIDAEVVIYGEDPSTTQNVMQIAFSGADSDRFVMGFGVEAGASLLSVELTGGGSLIHRDATGSTPYPAGSHDIVLDAGWNAIMVSGVLSTLDVRWLDPAGSGSSSGDLLVDSIAGMNGVSIRSTSSGDVETLWIGGTNETTSVVDLALEVVGTDVERTLMWVGDVTATGIVLPDEASDMTPTTFPVGYSTLTARNAGFFSLVLYDGSDDDGGDGDGCDGDLNGDGMVDGADLTLLLGNWGVCP